MSSYGLPMGGRAGGQPAPFHKNAPQSNVNMFAGNKATESSGGMSNMDAFKAYFGIPSKPVYEAPSFFKHRQENYDLPDAWIGRNELLSFILISEVTASQEWMLTKLLPWKYTTHYSIMLEVWKFSDHMLSRTPEEGVSRMLTSSFDSTTSYMHRYGIAFIVEHGFWKTEKGKKQYAMNIKQIKFAIDEGACYGALLACFDWHSPTDPNEDLRPSVTNNDATQIEKILDPGHQMFAHLQTGGRYALESLVSKGRAILENRGISGEPLLVLPNSARKYVKHYPENEMNFYTGKSKPVDAAEGLGVEVKYSRMFRQGERMHTTDPAFRDAYIGGFNQLCPAAPEANLLQIPVSEYRTYMSDIVVYDEAKDDYTQLWYEEAARLSGAYQNWHTTNPTLAKAGEQFFGTFKKQTWGHICDMSNIKSRTLDAILEKLTDREYEKFCKLASRSIDRFNASKPSSAEATRSTNIGAPPTLSEAELLAQRSSIIQYNREHIMKCVSSSHTKQVKAMLEQIEIEDLEKINLTRPSLMTTLLFRIRSLKSQSVSAKMMYALIVKDWCETYINRISASSAPIDNAVSLPTTRFMVNNPLFANHHLDDKFNYSVASDDTIRRIMGSTNLTAVALKSTSPVTQDRSRPSSIVTNAINIAVDIVLSAQSELDSIGLFMSREQVFSDVLTDGLRVAPCQYFTSKLFDSVRSLWILLTTPNATEDDKRLAYRAVKSIVDQSDFDEIKEIPAQDFPSERKEPELTEAERLSKEAEFNKVFDAVCKTIKDDTIKSNKDVYRNVYIEMVGRRSGVTDKHMKLIIPLLHTTTKSSRSTLLAAVEFITNYNTGRLTKDQELVVFDLIHKINTSTDSSLEAFSSNFNALLAETQNYIEIKKQQQQLASEKLQFVLSASGPLASDIRVYTLNELMYDYELFVMRSHGRDQVAEWRRLYMISDSHGHAELGDLSSIFTLFKSNISNETKRNLLVEYVRLVFSTHNRWNNVSLRDFFIQMVRMLLLTRCDPKTVISRDAISVVHNIVQQYIMTSGWISLDLQQRFNDSFSGALRGLSLGDLWTGSGVYVIGTATLASQLATEVCKTLISTAGAWPYQMTLSSASTPTLDSRVITRMSREDLNTLLDDFVETKDGWFWVFCIENDIMPPIGLIAWRHRKCYRMGSAFMAIKGGVLGYTYWGHPDFMLGDDANRKMHFGHFTMYMKPLIEEPRALVVFHNIFCEGYQGGNNTKIVNPLNVQEVHAYRIGNSRRSMIIALELANWWPKTKYNDVTGRYHPRFNPSSNTLNVTYYRSAQFITDTYGLAPKDYYIGTDRSNRNVNSFSNTICTQDHQFGYDHRTGRYDTVVRDQGPWTDMIYPGCGRVRNGYNDYLEKINFESKYGITNPIVHVR